MVTLLLKGRHKMMTLRLKRCVSLFVCLSLLVSACSPDKSSKAGSKASSTVDMARNQSNIQGLVPHTDTSAGNNRSRWYKPTWYTVATELGVGIGVGETTRRYFEKEMSTETALVFYVPTIASALLAGEAARAVTTGFELGPVAGAGAGVLTGAVTGGLTGATILTTLISILNGNFNDLFSTIVFGGVGGAILGGIIGLATGIETGFFAKRPKKPDNQKQNVNETTNNATTKDNPKAETGEAKA
ncbi:MAG: hypothetical protein LE178_04205 [Endomicrobium sp.]|nr:hypothetical protein [Endomicrobium sp.]